MNGVDFSSVNRGDAINFRLVFSLDLLLICSELKEASKTDFVFVAGWEKKMTSKQRNKYA